MLRRMAWSSTLLRGGAQVRSCPFELGAAELGVGLGVDRRLGVARELHRPPRPAPPGVAAGDRDVLGEQRHAVLGAVRESQESLRVPARADPLDRHLHRADLGPQQHLRARDSAPQRIREQRVGDGRLAATAAYLLGDGLDRGPRDQQRHRPLCTVDPHREGGRQRRLADRREHACVTLHVHLPPP